MKNIQVLISLIVLMIIVAPAYPVKAQPILPREEIPFSISPEIKREIEKLYSTNPQERADAVDEFGKMGGKAAAAVPYLVDLLSDTGRIKPYGFVGTKAVEALVKIGSASVEPLIEALNVSKERVVRTNATLALGQLEDNRAIEPLIATFKKEDNLFRIYTAEALGQIGKPAISYLEPILQDPDVRMREDAIMALGHIAMYKRDLRAAEFLVFSLNDREASVRLQAALALFNISNWYKPISAIDALIIALDDDNAQVQGYAAAALGNIGNIRVIQPLIGALKYNIPPQTGTGVDVRKNVIDALVKIGKPAVDYLFNALGDNNADIREGAARVLGLLKEVRSIERLIALLADADSDVRLSAAVSLKEIGGPSVDPLIVSLRGAHPEIQALIAKVLNQITGENFGNDEVKWHEWWGKNRNVSRK
ncbi:MAG: HEAT repeat domain-containing protein [Candidatus Omnitrophica bacterium]|nr:HEAT repeat domain-containing protein [Candidatus Omnitrophota bacterium]